MRTNKTLGKLRAGENAIGFSMGFHSPETIEMMAAMGFDYVTLDLEHAAFDASAVSESIRAADAYDITPIVRTPSDRDLILRLLNAGAQGVHLPHINTAADVREAVSATRFYPLGRRTFYATGRSGNYGIAVKDAEFAAHANRETLLIIQIEEQEGIANLNDILAVPGIDAIQFGPKDLWQSMGFPDPDDVWEQIEGSVGQVVAAGLWVSMVGWMGSDPNSDKLSRYGDLGVRLVTGQPSDFLKLGAEAFLERLRHFR
jgi:2-keto-3-deoxy-L-rhamnonate aldolase RhmA